jgi:hypothetical protein
MPFAPSLIALDFVGSLASSPSQPRPEFLERNLMGSQDSAYEHLLQVLCSMKKPTTKLLNLF